MSRPFLEMHSVRDYSRKGRSALGPAEFGVVVMVGQSAMANSIMVIHPYKYEGMWVFDDPSVGLLREPFVSGADAIIDRMVRNIPGAQNGFNLVFSATAFPGHELELERGREEAGGYWYFSQVLAMEGWLCPALFKYFDVAPDVLYAQFQAVKK